MIPWASVCWHLVFTQLPYGHVNEWQPWQWCILLCEFLSNYSWCTRDRKILLSFFIGLMRMKLNDVVFSWDTTPNIDKCWLFLSGKSAYICYTYNHRWEISPELQSNIWFAAAAVVFTLLCNVSSWCMSWLILGFHLERLLRSNAVPHWMGVNLESLLYVVTMCSDENLKTTYGR